MDLSARGLKMLYEFEGRHKKLPDGRYKAYRCPANVATIYCGLTKGVKDGMIVTEAEGERLLVKELSGYEDAVERLVKVELNQNEFDALVLLVFNIGIGAFQKSTLLKLLNQGKRDAASAQFMRWVNGGGKRLNGLVKRRAAEAALFCEPEAEDAPTEMLPQKIEPAVPSVPQVVQGSKTVHMSALGILATTFGQAWEWLFGVAKEAGPEVVTNQTALSPFNALLTTVGANMGLIAAVIAIGTLIIVIQRKVASERA
jgi:lysozyme